MHQEVLSYKEQRLSSNIDRPQCRWLKLDNLYHFSVSGGQGALSNVLDTAMHSEVNLTMKF